MQGFSDFIEREEIWSPGQKAMKGGLLGRHQEDVEPKEGEVSKDHTQVRSQTTLEE